jgi:hypothetical protein
MYVWYMYRCTYTSYTMYIYVSSNEKVFSLRIVSDSSKSKWKWYANLRKDARLRYGASIAKMQYACHTEATTANDRFFPSTQPTCIRNYWRHYSLLKYVCAYMYMYIELGTHSQFCLARLKTVASKSVETNARSARSFVCLSAML